jgi:hypothetical protein
MGHLEVWKVIEEMITDLRRKGIVVPLEAVTELRCAKTLIHVLEADPNQTDISQEIDKCLFGLECNMMSKGQVLGAEYLEKWTERFEKAKGTLGETKGESTLLWDIPRCSKWVRINSSALSFEETSKFADELHLTCIPQDEGVMLVQGEDEQLRELVKRMAGKNGKPKGPS